MRKTKTLFMLLVAFLLVGNVYAEKVTESQARKVATKFAYKIKANNSSSTSINDIDISDLITEKLNGEEVYYIYNLSPEGFVIVSAESAMDPILGYSMEGIISEDLDNDNFNSWMSTYASQIDYFRANNIEPTPELEAAWDLYINGSLEEITGVKASQSIVDPLLTCEWNQDSPYNLLCPEDEDGPGDHVYAGCVATAMSMIMYHYKYPEHGTGTETYYCYPYGSLSADFGNTYYNWDAMLDEVSTGSAEQSILAVAELQYHCGVAVNMGYAPDGSGAYSYNVPSAIKDYFNYSNDASYLQKDYYTLTQWIDMIDDNLENDHPIYYSGSSSEGGHAFCLDGSDGSDMFHFNFGWSGYGNGYFLLEGTNAVGGYSNSQGMVRNFYPDQNEYPAYCGDKTLNNLGGSFDDGGMPYQAYGTDSDCSWLLTAPTAQDSIDYFEFEFLEFDLEDGDYLRFYDGATTDSPLLGEFTGSTMPSDFNSTSDNVLVTFVTNSNETDNTGFRVEYKANMPSYCAGVTNFTEPTGTFDDGSGEYNYLNSKVCQYIIAPENANELELTFDAYDMAEGDRLLIYATNPTALLAELTSDDNPTVITSTTGSVMMTFQTDNLYSADGFTISYTIDNIGVSYTDIFTKFSVYPVPTTNTLTIDMQTESTEDMLLRVTSIDGKILVEENIKNYGGSFYKELNVSNLDKGVYLLNVYSEEGVATKRFIVK